MHTILLLALSQQTPNGTKWTVPAGSVWWLVVLKGKHWCLPLTIHSMKKIMICLSNYLFDQSTRLQMFVLCMMEKWNRYDFGKKKSMNDISKYASALTLSKACESHSQRYSGYGQDLFSGAAEIIRKLFINCHFATAWKASLELPLSSVAYAIVPRFRYNICHLSVHQSRALIQGYCCWSVLCLRATTLRLKALLRKRC